MRNPNLLFVVFGSDQSRDEAMLLKRTAEIIADVSILFNALDNIDNDHDYLFYKCG